MAHRLLTIRPPWSWAVVWGHKPVENRSGGAGRWRRAIGTELWVHASLRWSERGGASPLVVRAWIEATGRPDPYRARLDRPVRLAGTTSVHPSVLDEQYPADPPQAQVHLGAVVGKVAVTGVHDAEPGCCTSEWAEHQYRDASGKVVAAVAHLVLAEPRYLPDPVPCAGRLGLWRPWAL